MILFKFDIGSEDGETQRRLGPGVYVLGGGLTADLVVPALDESEVCEITLPADPAAAIRVVPLVEGVVVNGRKAQPKLSISARTQSIEFEGVSIAIAAVDAEAEPAPAATSKASRLFEEWREKSRQAVDRQNLPTALHRYPSYALFGMAGLLAVLAIVLSGWPMSSLMKMNRGPSVAATDRANAQNALAEIRRRLTAGDLGAFVRADQSGNAIRLSGVVNPVQAPRLDEIVKVMSRPGAPAIRNDVTMSSADAATGVEGVVTSPVKSVIAGGGRIFNEGQTIPTGWFVERIMPQAVTLRRDGVAHVINLVDAAATVGESTGSVPAPSPGAGTAQGAPPRQVRAPAPAASATQAR